MSDTLAGIEAIDREDLAERLGEEIELSLDLFELFFEDAPPRIEQMRERLDDGDAPELKRLAHTLKGSAASVSAARIRALAERIEHLAAEGLTGEISPFLVLLPAELETLRVALAELAD